LGLGISQSGHTYRTRSYDLQRAIVSLPKLVVVGVVDDEFWVCV